MCPCMFSNGNSKTNLAMTNEKKNRILPNLIKEKKEYLVFSLLIERKLHNAICHDTHEGKLNAL